MFWAWNFLPRPLTAPNAAMPLTLSAPDRAPTPRSRHPGASSSIVPLAVAITLGLVLAIALVPGPEILTATESETAHGAYLRGLALQKERHTLEAIEAYLLALQKEPFHGRANYEIGWSYWVLGRWADVVRHWEIARDLGVDVAELPEFLDQARQQLEGKLDPLVRVPIGIRAQAPTGGVTSQSPSGGRPPLALELVARFQHYDPNPSHPADHFDRYVFSPKSVHFSPDGKKVYVNALEGFATLVFAGKNPERRTVIIHRYGPAQQPITAGAAGASWGEAPGFAASEAPDRFAGKPVEFATTHGGRYLWISYYRWDYDLLGVFPSAVAVVDTRRDEIVRVIATGPIPKYLAASPDGKWLAVIHWGDNTVGLIDVSGERPEAFRRAALITVGRRLSLEIDQPLDRDRYCGYCLRGAVFTPDSRHLLVGKMGGGGIAVLDVAEKRHLGTVHGMKSTPRHLVLSPDGKTLYVSSNFSGYVAAFRTAELVTAARNGRSRISPLRETHTGAGTRTIALTPDGTLLFAAVHNSSQVMALDATTLDILLEIPADSYPVGLAVSPDGRRLWVTSQGRKLRGGNSVSVYRIDR